MALSPPLSGAMARSSAANCSTLGDQASAIVPSSAFFFSVGSSKTLRGGPPMCESRPPTATQSAGMLALRALENFEAVLASSQKIEEGSVGSIQNILAPAANAASTWTLLLTMAMGSRATLIHAFTNSSAFSFTLLRYEIRIPSHPSALASAMVLRLALDPVRITGRGPGKTIRADACSFIIPSQSETPEGVEQSTRRTSTLFFRRVLENTRRSPLSTTSCACSSRLYSTPTAIEPEFFFSALNILVGAFPPGGPPCAAIVAKCFATSAASMPLRTSGTPVIAGSQLEVLPDCSCEFLRRSSLSSRRISRARAASFASTSFCFRSVSFISSNLELLSSIVILVPPTLRTRVEERND
mmetsp:Transcript_62481/g.101056  ORF Transcript_62481/g.101056 Transcript_62481/m.101056 type:complete len:356 (+) Transcript_62481:196-1263(+)